MNLQKVGQAQRHGREGTHGLDLYFRITLTHECLDASVTAALGDPAAKAQEHQIITLDCTKVRFADSSGLGLLIRLQAQYPGRVHLVNVQPGLRRCLAKVAKGLLPQERIEETTVKTSNPMAETTVMYPAGGLAPIEPTKVSSASTNFNTHLLSDRRALGLSPVLVKNNVRAVRVDDSRAHACLDDGYSLSPTTMKK